MREFQERRYLRRIFFSRPVFALFLCLAVFLGFSLEKTYKESREAILKNKRAEEEVSVLGERKEDLEANLQRLKTQIGIEEELRGKFQIKKTGEEFVVIIDEDINKDNSVQEEPGGFFKKFFDSLKSIF